MSSSQNSTSSKATTSILGTTEFEVLPIRTVTIPAALKDFNRWVVWNAVSKSDGKVAKQPRIARSPTHGASVNNTEHWASCDVAVNAAQKHGCSGIGFVMTNIQPELNLIAIDIDHCVTGDARILNELSTRIVGAIPEAYWEYSPSGTGVRGFCLGTISRSFLNHEKGVEIYNGDSSRYLTVTGHILPHSSLAIGSANEDSLAKLHTEFCTSSTAMSKKNIPIPEMPLLDDEGTSLFESIQGKPREFALTGQAGEYDHDYSRAVLALAVGLLVQGISDNTALSALRAHASSWETALRHRQGNEQRALGYLWKTVQKAKHSGAGASSPDEFEILAKSAQVTGIDGHLGGKINECDEVTSGCINLTFVGDLQGVVPPQRQWLVDQWIPAGTVTLLYGDGGTGKTLIAQQLMTCVALGIPWFGIPTMQGQAIGVFCEDDEDELLRRQIAICDKHFAHLSEVGQHSAWNSRVGLDSVLMTFNGPKGEKTPFYQNVGMLIAKRRPTLLVLDTAADMFAGAEVDRTQVRQFMSALARPANLFNCAIVLCAHPSVAGAKAGTSGSTAWNNSARSRLFMKRDDADPEIRLLSKAKSNYASVGESVPLAWKSGVFFSEDEGGGEAFSSSREQLVENFFVSYLTKCAGQGGGRRLSSSRNSDSSKNAPKVIQLMAKQDGEQVTLADLQGAMERLMASGRVVLKPGLTRKHGNYLVVAK